MEALNVGTADAGATDRSNDLVLQVMEILSGVTGFKPSTRMKLKDVIKRAVDRYEADIKGYEQTVEDLHKKLDEAYE